MTIVYFCNFIGTSGGLDRIVIEKANYLAREYDVYIVTTAQKQKKYFYDLDKRVKHIDFSEYGGTSIWLGKKVFKKIMSNINPDIIIAPTGKESLVLPFFDKHTIKIKEMHFSRDYRKIHNQNANSLKKLIVDIVDKIELKVYAKYNAVIPLTYEDEKKWDLKNTQVIYNFKPFESAEVSLCSEKVVMTAGRLEYEKGFDMLLKAWQKVCVKNKAWKLIIYGEGKLKNDLIELTKSLEIKERVKFAGNVTDIKEEYIKSSIYVMSSRHEGMPLSLIEAMECGLPLVSFACPSGPVEMIQDGKNGLLAINQDIDSLSEKLLYLMTNDKKRVKMGKISKNKSKYYAKDIIMDKWKDLFSMLLKEKG